MQKEICGKNLDDIFMMTMRDVSHNGWDEVNNQVEFDPGFTVEGETVDDVMGKEEARPLDFRIWKKMIHIEDEEDRQDFIDMMDPDNQKEYDGMDDADEIDLLGDPCLQIVEKHPNNTKITREMLHEAIQEWNKANREEKQIIEKRIEAFRKELEPSKRLMGIFNRNVARRDKGYAWDFHVTYKDYTVAWFIIRAKEKNNGIAWWVHKTYSKKDEETFKNYEGKVQTLTADGLPFRIIVTINNGSVELANNKDDFNFFDSMGRADELDHLEITI